jgi:hypothetical protein
MKAQLVFPVKQGNKWGLVNEKGEFSLRPTYDAIGKYDKFGYAKIQDKDKVGLIDTKGNIAVEAIYQDIRVVDTALFSVQENENWSIVNDNKEPILVEDYSRIEKIENSNFYKFHWNNKIGLFSKRGVLLTKAIYSDIIISNFNRFVVQKTDDQNRLKSGLIDERGQIVIPIKYKNIQQKFQNFIFIQTEEGWGICANDATILAKAKWQKWTNLNDNWLKLSNKEANTLFNIQNQTLLAEGKYDNFIHFSDVAVMIRKGRNVGLMDFGGNELLNCEYDEIQLFTENSFRVKKNGKWGIVGSGTEAILKTIYDYIAPLKGSVAGIRKNGAFGIINFQGKIVVNFEYDKISLEENQAKAYKGQALSIFNFNDDGKLQNEHNYKKVGSIKIGRKVRNRRAIRAINQRRQLDNYEWFHDPMEDRWGLRDISTGAIKIKPIYDVIKVERDLGFTLVGMEVASPFQIERTEFRIKEAYGVVNNERGLQVTELNMWNVRLTDFTDKKLPVARVVFNNERHGLMAKNGKIIHDNLTFLGEFENGKARFSNKGEFTATSKKTDEGLGILIEYLMNLETIFEMVSVTRYDMEFRDKGQMICRNCIWGFMDTLGEIVIQPKFEYTRDYINGVAIAKQNGKYGLIDTIGNTILDFKYNDVQFLENCENQMVRVTLQKQRIGLIDSTGKVIVPAIYEAVGKVSEDRIPVKRGGKWGFCDKSGAEIIPCQYQAIQAFSEGLAAFKKDRRWGFLDENGGIVIENKYRKVGSFKGNLAAVKSKYDFQYIDNQGNIIIKTFFDDARDFKNGVAAVKIGKYWGLIDLSGNFVDEPSKYLKIDDFDENGLAIVQMGNNKRYYAVINQNGEKITNKKYQKILPFSNGFAAVRTNNGYGFINMKGELIIDDKFNRVVAFFDNIATVQINGKWGYIDTIGNYVLEPIYSKVMSFQNGFGVVYENYKTSGLVNSKGEFTIKPSVDRLLGFSEGKALHRSKDYNFSFVNENNKLIKGGFQDAKIYKNGVAIVKQKGRWGLITHQGIEVVPPKYDEINTFENGYAEVKINQFNGVMDLTGKVIVEPNYEYIKYWGNGIFRVENGDKMGYFNNDGNWIWAMD